METPNQIFRKRVQKHVDLVQVDTSNFTLVQRKAVNVLFHCYIKKCESLNIEHYDDFIAIPLDILKVLVNYEKNDNYKFFQEMEKMSELSIKYVFKDENDHTRHRTLVLFHTIDYVPETGMFLFNVNKNISPMLYNPQMYTKIYLGLSRIFRSKHSLSLWENCKVHLHTGKTPFYDIPTWKKLLGVSEMYDEFRVFNQKVIKKSVEEINGISDITIKPIYKRESRAVVAIAFTVSRNPTGNQEWIKHYPIEIQGYLMQDQDAEMNNFWLKRIKKQIK